MTARIQSHKYVSIKVMEIMRKLLKRILAKSFMIGGVLLWPTLSFAQTSYVLTGADNLVLENQEALTHVWRDKTRGDGALDVFGAIDINACLLYTSPSPRDRG